VIIILEGVDCGGKGWMAERLLKSIPNCYYLKHGNKPANNSEGEIAKLHISYNTMLKTYNEAIRPNGGNVIFDRFYPSELVYGSVVRRYNINLTRDEALINYYKELESKVNQEPHLYIEIFADKADILKRMEIRGEDYLEQELVSPVLESYEAFFETTSLTNKYRLRSSQTNVENIVGWVRAHGVSI
tara:strand:+ start:1371 stop:1931 length:561 start_codon:yes stop_codon:yes gene_type:complete